MEKKKNTYNHKTTEVLIYVMGGIGIYMALGAIFVGNLMGYIMLMIIPLFLSIMFMITKQPIYGILYTILFIYNRKNLFTEVSGYFLIYIFLFGAIIFFTDVSYRSYVRWKEIRKNRK